MVVSVLSLGCDDSMISEAFREVLSMLDEVCYCCCWWSYVWYTGWAI